MIQCVINTPISEETSKEGDMIILPAVDGEIGVLKGHMNLIVELKEGIIKIYKNKKIIDEINIQNSIAYIKNDGIEILSSF